MVYWVEMHVVREEEPQQGSDEGQVLATNSAQPTHAYYRKLSLVSD